jgi:hypothetical protein
MMAGNLNIEQRKWIVKHYWKTENAERVRTAWVEAFNTPPLTHLTFYRIRDKFDATGSVANAQKSGNPRTYMTEENEFIVAMTFVNSPKKSTRRAAQELSLPRTSLRRLMRKLNLKPYRPGLNKCQYLRRTINNILYTICCIPTFGPPCIIRFINMTKMW